MVVYEGHPFYDRETIAFRELEGEPLVSLNEMFYVHQVLMDLCQENGMVPTLVHTSMEDRMLIHYVRTQKGLAFITDFSLSGFETSGLRFVPLAEHPKWPVYLVADQSVRKHSSVAQFFDYCVTHADRIRIGD